MALITELHERNIEEPSARGMELLAPAGTVEAFEAAVNGGADAVYIGAPALNARALAKHFTMDEIAAMIAYAHRTGVKVYVAMNSLVKEEEVPKTVETLASLEGLQADGLILQDLGVYLLAKKYFPGLRLHASTLLTAHNSPAILQCAQMGFDRVVLARELTIDEISRIHRSAPDMELEVFIHGAMCFSYSGLCLFSSYLGGKSGLRGRCVQPCRRRYTWSGKGKGASSGYFFSMNDLIGIELLPQLREAGVGSLKIEGRMRSAHYVSSVVRAYRMVLDAAPEDESVMADAKELLKAAMGRRTGAGYFLSSQPKDLLSPQHSGNIGFFLGRIKSRKGKNVLLTLQEPVRTGDRLRLHLERSGERMAFTLKRLYRSGKAVNEAGKGEVVGFELPGSGRSGDSLYKVDVSERLLGNKKRAPSPTMFSGAKKFTVNRARVGKILDAVTRRRDVARKQGGAPRNSTKGRSDSMEWWLRIDDFRLLKHHFPVRPAKLVVLLNRETFAQFSGMRRYIEPYIRDLIWALPPIIHEAELRFYENAVQRLRKSKFSAWQIGHIGQLSLFQGKRKQGRNAKKRKRDGGKKPHYTIIGDYTINVLNSQSLELLRQYGISHAQAAIETDKDNLSALVRQARGVKIGVTVYGRPALFTARVTPSFFRYDRSFISPKGETFFLRKESGRTIALPERPFSLLSHMPELAAMGISYGVVDLSRMHMRKQDMEKLVRQLTGSYGGRVRLSAFNYLGTLE